MSNSEEFSKLFSELEELIKKRAYNFGLKEINVPFGNFLRYLEEQKDSFLKKYYIELDRINDIRNLIIHPHPTLTVEPTLECLSKLREIINVFERRIKAEDIMVREIFKKKVNDQIPEVIETIVNKDYSQVPIIDSEERVIGLLTENSIVKWLRTKIKEGIVDLEAKVSDVGFFKENEGVYKFISRDLELEKIQEIFIKSYESAKPLFALIVTQSGKQSERMLGIITAEDAFLKIKSG